MAQRQNIYKQLKSGFTMLVMGSSIFVGHALLTGNERFYREVVMPCARKLDSETAHYLGVQCARFHFFPRRSNSAYPSLSTQVWGLTFPHPVGLAAGFDKHGEAVSGLLASGFAFVEVGSVTPEPQPGNPKPRVFRLTEDRAVINRYGFNSDGHDAVYERLRCRDWEGRGIVGVNLGKNKTSTDAAADFVAGVAKFGEVADYLVINVSSPNTPGLRDLQKKAALSDMLAKVMSARNKLKKKTPVLLKLSPDESDEDIKNIVAVLKLPECRVDGLIVSNTTVARPSSLTSPHSHETGGLSGPPLAAASTALIGRLHRLTGGSVPIVGVGGVSSGADVADKLGAGAVLVQVYTGLVYEGPLLVDKVCRELVELRRKTEVDAAAPCAAVAR